MDYPTQFSPPSQRGRTQFGPRRGRLRISKQLLREYFRHVRNGLSDDGIFFLGAYGGYDCCKVTQDRNECDGSTYIWDQAAYNIHFEFPDGSRLNSAFRYD